MNDEYNKFGSRKNRWKTGTNPKGRNYPCYLLDIDVDIIEKFIAAGMYKNRSEVFRIYIRNGVIEDIKNIKLLNESAESKELDKILGDLDVRNILRKG